MEVWFLENISQQMPNKVHVSPRFRWAKWRFLFYVLSVVHIHVPYLLFQVVYCQKKKKKIKHSKYLDTGRCNKKNKVYPVMLICWGPWSQSWPWSYVTTKRIDSHFCYIPQTSYRLFIFRWLNNPKASLKCF